jgi:DnaJ C terminal domain
MHPRMRTSSQNGFRSNADLHELLERLLTPVEDLVEVMSVPVDTAETDVGVPAAPPHETATSAAETVAVRESVARDGGRALVGVAALADCPACGGWGTTDGHRCESCAGSGRVQQSRQLEVDIPPGVVTGDLLRVPGESAAGGDLPGDLLLQVLVVSDRLRRNVIRDVAATPVEKPKRFRRLRRRQSDR